MSGPDMKSAATEAPSSSDSSASPGNRTRQISYDEYVKSAQQPITQQQQQTQQQQFRQTTFQQSSAQQPIAQQQQPQQQASPSPAPGSQTIADHVLGDQPAASAKADRLGFAPYVAAVAEFLTDSSTRTPLTLSIEGQWGSGKSSFMLQLQEALKSRGKSKIVSFNAWQYNADDGLWAAFIHEFDTKLNAQLTFREKIAARLRLLALRLSWQESLETAKSAVWLLATVVALVSTLVYLHHGGLATLLGALQSGGETNKSAVKIIAAVGGAGGTVAALLLLLNQFKELFKSPASFDKTTQLFARPNYSARLPFIHQVTRDFKSLVEAYAGQQDVYIFVDDLDRCEYSKAAELMQALLMLLSSAPSVALIIGLDREKVAAAMAAKQEKLLPYLYKVQPAAAFAYGMDYGHRFLEKFIQLSYFLPTAGLSGLKAMINPDQPAPQNAVPASEKSVAAIEIVTGKDDARALDEIIDMVDQVFDHNPRNVKQFVNMFRLQAFIANETGLFGSLRVTRDTGCPLTIPQLAKFVALCLRWPSFIEAAVADFSLVGYLEDSFRPKASDTPAPPTGTDDPRNSWLRDPSLSRLFCFKVDEPSYSLDGVNLNSLTEITPARVRDLDYDRASVQTPAGAPNASFSASASPYPNAGPPSKGEPQQQPNPQPNPLRSFRSGASSSSESSTSVSEASPSEYRESTRVFSERAQTSAEEPPGSYPAP